MTRYRIYRRPRLQSGGALEPVSLEELEKAFEAQKYDNWQRLTFMEDIYSGASMFLGDYAYVAVERPLRQNPHRKRKNPGRRSIHTRKFDRCVKEVKARGGSYNPYAVCESAIGYKGSIKAGHRRENTIRYVLKAENTKTGQLGYFTGRGIDSNKSKAKIFRDMDLAAAAMQRIRLPKNWALKIREKGETNPAGEKLYEDFHGEPYQKVRREHLPNFSHGIEVGPVIAIAYETRRDGERAVYEHEFKKHAAPKLVASTDGRALGLTGGAYRFTDRGITDL